MKFGKLLFSVLVFVLFSVCVGMSLKYCSEILRSKENPPIQDNFAALDPDSVDVVFIGTSHQFCTINPDLLFDEYHINSYMLATSAQTIPMSYYAAMEAIELQHPETIVMEMLYCANDFRTVTSGMSHAFFDGMPDCEAKKLALEDLIEEKERIYFRLPLGVYHSRWKELEERDFGGITKMPRGRYYDDTVFPNWAIPVTDREEKEEMPEEMFRYIEMLVQLCRENNVKLIWYVAPFGSMYDVQECIDDLFRRQRIFNWVGDYAEQNGIPFYNLFYEIDNLGIDYGRDFMDSQHFNCYGQDKITRYMADRGYFGEVKEKGMGK